ncbi:hypothetical protein EDB83DRAFT_1448993 [Lactarius deliciosus]|nr:hypothetical protein EDB83DRAFT_1448993 [Lactarius deliciosus]
MSFFCFILFISLCLAASLKSSPPRHMYVHGHRVHPSPYVRPWSPRPSIAIATPITAPAALCSSSPNHYRYCLTARKPVAAVSTRHFVRHPVSRRARLVMTPHRGDIATPPPCADNNGNNRRRWDVAGHDVGPLLTLSKV